MSLGEEQDVFAALGDPTRRRILELLADGSVLRVSDISEAFDMTRQAVTKHLNILRDAGMTETRWQGRDRLTSVSGTAVDPLRAWLAKYDAFWSEKLAQLKQNIEEGEGS